MSRTNRTEFIIMMHHLWRAGYAQQAEGKYDVEKAWKYFEQIEQGGDTAPVANLTPKGRQILEYLATVDEPLEETSAKIGAAIGVASRSVSGSMRKLISDGFAIKGNSGGATSFYMITEEGKAAL